MWILWFTFTELIEIVSNFVKQVSDKVGDIRLPQAEDFLAVNVNTLVNCAENVVGSSDSFSD